MIQYITNTNPHILRLTEKHDDMRLFLEEMIDIFIRYEMGNFQTPDGKVFKAVLMNKTEVTKTTRVTQQKSDQIYSWTAQQTRELTLEYHFKEIE